MDSYTKSLAHEYLETIRNIASGMYNGDELHYLEADRSVLHKQLERAIGKRIPKDEMPEYARSL